MALQCHVCHVALNSSVQFRQHILGQSHARKLHKLECVEKVLTPPLGHGQDLGQDYGQSQDQGQSALDFGQDKDPWRVQGGGQIGRASDDTHAFGRGSRRFNFEQNDGGGGMDMEWEEGGGVGMGGGRGMRAIRGTVREAEYSASHHRAQMSQRPLSGQRASQGFSMAGPMVNVGGSPRGSVPRSFRKAEGVPVPRSFPAQAVYVETAMPMPSAVGVTAANLQRGSVGGYVIRGGAPVLAASYQRPDTMTLDHTATGWPFREDSPPFIDDRHSFRDEVRDSLPYRDSRQPFRDNSQSFRDDRQSFRDDSSQPFKDSRQPFRDDSQPFRDNAQQFGNDRSRGNKGGQKFAASVGQQQRENDQPYQSQNSQPFGSKQLSRGSSGTGSPSGLRSGFNNNTVKGNDTTSSGSGSGSSNTTTNRQTHNMQQQQKPHARFQPHHPGPQQPPPPSSSPPLPPPPPAETAEEAKSSQQLVLGDHMGVVSVNLKDQDKLHCQLCIVSFSSEDQAQAHYCGAKHARKARVARLRELGALTDDNQNKTASEFYCSDCNIMVNNEDQLKAHQEGARHKKTVEQRKRKAGSQMDTEPVEKTTQGSR